MPGIILPGKRRFRAVLLGQLGLTEIISFDREFDRVIGVRRVEP